MSVGNTIAADTIGFLWRAATHTVDPWTKANIDEQQAADMVQAMPNAVPQQQQGAIAKSLSEIDNYLRSIGAHPSQATAGLAASLKNAGLYIALALVAVVLLFGYAQGRGARTA